MDREECKPVRATKSSKNAGTQNWQAKHDTSMDSLGFLLFNEIMSDITFIVGSKQVRIPAHKFILSIRSNVFHTMFYGILCEANEVEIPDIEPSAFRKLLQYLYVSNVTIEPESVITTLYAAKKYNVPGLELRCENLLATSLKTENAFLLLKQARFFDATHLISSCLNMIDKQTQACLDAKCFLDIDYDTLEVVVSRDTLRIKEILLYEAVKRWSEAECKRRDFPVTSDNQKRVLKDCVKLLRYPLMSNQEFALGPAQSGLLTDKEVAHVFLYINSSPKADCDFQNKPRSATSEYVCIRFRGVPKSKRINRGGYYSDTINSSINFRVDQNIFVSGFGFYGSPNNGLHYDIDIELKNIANNTSIASNSTTILSDGTTKIYKILFKEPVEVLALTGYRVVAKIKHVQTLYCGTNESNNVTVTCDNRQNVEFQFFNNPGWDKQLAQIIFYL